MRAQRLRSLASPDGFGLAEVVVSMFLFSTIALAILPMLVSGLKQSLNDQNLTTATQLVDARSDLVRSQGSTCSLISALAGVSTSTTPAGVPVTSTTTVAGAAVAGTPCPAATSAYPTTVTVTSSVTRTSTGAVLAKASTQVYVSAP